MMRSVQGDFPLEIPYRNEEIFISVVELGNENNNPPIEMRKTVVSQGLAYQHPMDDSGQERHPMLLNDGREVPKFPQSDQTAYGYFQSYLQREQNKMNDLCAPTPDKQQLGSKSLRLKFSKGTVVCSPESPKHDVIWIDSDKDDKCPEISSLGNFSNISLKSNIRVSKWTQPTSPCPPQVSLAEKKSKKVIEDDEPSFDISQMKIREGQDGKVVEQIFAPQVVDTGQPEQFGIQMRTGGIEDLNEILELMEEMGEIPREKIRKNSFEMGKVVDGEKEALVELLNKEKELQTGVTGVLCAEIESSRYEEYNEGHFSVVKSLGMGSYGSVDLCKDANTDKEFVLKKVQKSFKVEEVVVLLYLEHENITGLYGYIKREGVSEILMEYAGTNLLNFVLRKSVLEEAQVWSITTQSLSALKYLEEHQIKHLDLKPENICVTNKMIVKLTDFGSAKMATQEQDYQGWTSEYMAPEMCRAFLKSRYPNLFRDDPEDFSLTGKVDVFALGLVVQFMLEKTHTQVKFYTDGASSYRQVQDVDKTRLNIIIANAKNPDMVVKHMLTDKGSIALRELIRGLLQGIPKNRLSAEQALLKIEAMKKKNMIPGGTTVAKEETPTKLSTFSRRRSANRQLSTMTSVCSNTSQIEEPMSPGPIKGRRKGRKRVCPYEPDDPKPIAIDNSLLGNVPDFSMLQG